MPKLFYVMNMSLDGYIEDKQGAVDFSPVDDEVFTDQTQLLASTGTFLYGRRLYDTMAVWETNPALAKTSQMTADFAGTWQAAEKIVYSTSLAEPYTAHTRIERRFEPEALRDLKAAATADITIGGPDLAGQAVQAGLVDEILMYVVPIILGGGKPGLPSTMRTRLELIDDRRFGNGVMRLTYRPTA
ncbi:MAG: dihydrofolate reductase family protein [Actinobacteria bacterium]|nr:dihydrofolate reductase family protein [Actinomycetota bacterium]